MASSSANERANASKKLRNQRGKTVVLVFSNQGLGNMCARSLSRCMHW